MYLVQSFQTTVELTQPGTLAITQTLGAANDKNKGDVTLDIILAMAIENLICQQEVCVNEGERKKKKVSLM